jgi:putative phosphoesterase
MRIAIISDIHGNLSALDSILEKIDKSSVDATICLGDVSASGPKPRECLSRLVSRNIPVVMGNKDEIFLVEDRSSQKKAEDEDMQRIMEIDEWCKTKLTSDDLNVIRSFKDKIWYELESGGFLCYHGSPRSNKELITSKTPDQDLDEAFSNLKGETMIGGHTHIPMLRSFRNLTLINPGSVGQAIERTPGQSIVRRAPWSEFAIIAFEKTGTLTGVEFARLSLDIQDMKSHADESGMPHAEWWATRK